ncbi:uncharacterized protein LOC114310916 [Camellia sinensis]|uniref:uncharacterized protein LOC114310916 n=1 Tax=Camellia sinensis TaxID=4442 RepID=UPI001035D2D9|nr:uncharacterized protein LOC114310916 [Camellia sinensis]
MAEVSEYENFTLTVQHSVLAIQHAYSFAMQAEEMKKELVHKTKEAAGLLKSLNKAEAKMKALIDQAKTAKQAQDEAEEKAGAAEATAEVLKAEKKEAEAKTAKAQAELRATLATKDAEIKAEDDKAYAKGVADVLEEYKKQDEEDEVSKGAPPKKTTSEVPIAEKSLNQTLQEIDAKLEAEKAAEKIFQLSFGAVTQPATDAE